MYKLSICIPTYNRCNYLANCLHSIAANTNYSKEDIQICISDNCSTDETEVVVRHAQEKIDIVYSKNERNIGLSGNFINVVNMADGEYVWIIGDDDLLLSKTLQEINEIIDQNNGVDYFYINSFHLQSEFVFSYPQPFDINNIPKNMKKFSSWEKKGQLPFLDLINPKISFDFLGGMFLSVFRRRMWVENIDKLNMESVHDGIVFSHFDNTFPHVKIFANAFCNSQAYFHPTPLSICLSGAREWAPMYPFIRSIRLIEVLDEYRKNGLSYWTYVRCKNYALRYFIPDILYILVYRKESGYKYLQPIKLLTNVFYPEFYLSFFRFVVKWRNIKTVFNLISSRNKNSPIQSPEKQ